MHHPHIIKSSTTVIASAAKQSDSKRNRKSSVECPPKTNDGFAHRQTAAGAGAITTIRLDSVCTFAVTASSPHPQIMDPVSIARPGCLSRNHFNIFFHDRLRFFS
ncbi:hypothetical protein [Cyclobacterium salsum]|uniref:hypothetical protein n=1 Tax=Cyclobacterium salsum TaxID=2666329 RepID=UPI00139079EC|nr:hypothetical protein [Cyclobacterium salsum]